MGINRLDLFFLFLYNINMNKKVPVEYTLKATIPTGQYANLQPEITIKAESLEEAEKQVLPYMEEMFNRFSETPLKEKEYSKLKKIKSFTEIDKTILFDPVNHKYFYKDKELTSATRIVGQYTKPFNSEYMSKKCSESWGVDQQELKNLWRGGGMISANFGTAIHEALEHYFKYKEIGDIIHHASASKTENAALPKHPLLKKIILELLEIDKIEGMDLPEVVITNVDKGYCGTVDKLKIIDTEKKICRIQDYKIIDEIESKTDKLKHPFDHLPATKLSHYQIQLSVYANIMQMSGWSVQGLDIFALEERGWEHYELEVLEVI